MSYIKLHHPPHIFLDRAYYFLTARTYYKQRIFNTDEKKKLLIASLKAEFQKYGFELIAWVVLDNHYHIEFKAQEAKELSKIVNLIHGRVSFMVNTMDGMRGRKVFQNYWDRGIRDDADFWKHFNYIHHNPVKHRYVKNMGDYQFSSYNEWVKKKGSEWMLSCSRLYPIVDFTLEEAKIDAT